MVKKVHLDTPLAELTLRKYEKPHTLQGRELVKKLLLSLGLLQPGDSRDVIVDLFLVLLEEQDPLTSEKIRQRVEERRKETGLSLVGITGSNIRRQLKRLREAFLVEKVAARYRILEGESLSNLFEEKVETYLLSSITERIKLYLKKVDEHFGRNSG
ncbi:MAG: hypothetical protein GXP63_02925 [DPANN group archaeon]|nr:hypothetical protein [DPANN group archaeon]